MSFSITKTQSSKFMNGSDSRSCGATTGGMLLEELSPEGSSSTFLLADVCSYGGGGQAKN